MRFLKFIYFCSAIACLSCSAAFAQQKQGRTSPATYGGDYNYVGNGYYSSPTDLAVNTVFDTLGTASDVVLETRNVLNRAGSFALWRNEDQYGYGNTGTSVSGGIGLQLQGPLQTQPLIGPQWAQSRWVQYKLGPFYVDNVYLGAGLIYSDYQGVSPYGGSNGVVGDDNWAMIVGLGARISFNISNRFAFTASPYVYWLPLKNQVGWAVGFPSFALFGGQFAPRAIFDTAYRIPIENGVELAFTDRFSAFYLQTSLLNESLLYQLNFMDTTPVDRAGRYQFGTGSVGFDSHGNSKFSLNNRLYDGDRFLYMNQLGVALRARLAENVYSNTYFNRYDFWNSSLYHLNAWDSLGTLLVKQGPVFSPYLMYEVNINENIHLEYHQAIAGVNANLNPNTVAYAQGGWLWAHSKAGGTSQSSGTWIAQTGMRQRIGPYTVHGADVGRMPFQGGLGGPRYISNFARYYVSQQLGARISMNFYVEKARMENIVGQGEGKREYLTAGAMAQVLLSDKSSMSIMASYDHVTLPLMNRGWNMWTYRAIYMRQFTDSLQGQVAYSYQTSTGVSRNPLDHFQEHFMYIGVMKRF